MRSALVVLVSCIVVIHANSESSDETRKDCMNKCRVNLITYDLTLRNLNTQDEKHCIRVNKFNDCIRDCPDPQKIEKVLDKITISFFTEMRKNCDTQRRETLENECIGKCAMVDTAIYRIKYEPLPVAFPPLARATQLGNLGEKYCTTVNNFIECVRSCPDAMEAGRILAETSSKALHGMMEYCEAQRQIWERVKTKCIGKCSSEVDTKINGIEYETLPAAFLPRAKKLAILGEKYCGTVYKFNECIRRCPSAIEGSKLYATISSSIMQEMMLHCEARMRDWQG